MVPHATTLSADRRLAFPAWRGLWRPEEGDQVVIETAGRGRLHVRPISLWVEMEAEAEVAASSNSSEAAASWIRTRCQELGREGRIADAYLATVSQRRGRSRPVLRIPLPDPAVMTLLSSRDYRMLMSKTNPQSAPLLYQLGKEDLWVWSEEALSNFLGSEAPR